MARRGATERTRTLRAGISTKISSDISTDQGFTLAEVLVVLMIVSLTLLVVFPTLVGLGGGELRQTSRDLIGSVQFLYQQAVATKRVHRLQYDLTRGEYWATVAADGGAFLPVRSTLMPRKALPPTVTFQDVWTLRDGKRVDGETATEFQPLGRVERTTIHLREAQGRTQTLTINPFTGRVRVEDGYSEAQNPG